MATDVMVMNELRRLNEHQSELLAMKLHDQDRKDRDLVPSFNKPWWSLLPELRSHYRLRARELMAERSFET